MNDYQIKTRKRVRDFGEVYTAQKQVRDMLDLVPDLALDTTYLEPACGNGNFLAEILKRKLSRVDTGNTQATNRDFFICISTIYGVDIQTDNVEESRARMLCIADETYTTITGDALPADLRQLFQTVLSYNIVCGNTLQPQDLTFSEWVLAGNKVKQREYLFQDMLVHGGTSGRWIEERIYTWHVYQHEAA